jgi:hypothetical protein
VQSKIKRTENSYIFGYSGSIKSRKDAVRRKSERRDN